MMDPSESSTPPLEARRKALPDASSTRFERLRRLVGPDALARLRAAHVLVVGLGGVGSWAAEALARSGIGRLTLADFDSVALSNFNRQLPALEGNVGSPKAEVLRERLHLVHPEADIRAFVGRFEEDNLEALLGGPPDFVVDAIDHVTSKCLLIRACRERGIPLVVSTGSGGRADPTRIAVADLAATEIDPLAAAVRKILRTKHGFPKEGLFGIPAVYSMEPPRAPIEEEREDPGRDPNRIVMGTAAFVTGAFGLACASVVVRTLAGLPGMPARGGAPRPRRSRVARHPRP